jgi:hypothetical protein
MSTLRSIMLAGAGEAARLRRLRWRLRGAWQWPAFTMCLGIDALLAHFLPATGDGASPVGAVLLAGFVNLALLAVLAPLGGVWLRRRRPDLPRVVANDYAGTALVVAAAVVLLVLGLIHQPALAAEQRAFAAQSNAVRAYVLAQPTATYRGNLQRADSMKLDDNLYRTCVPGDSPARALCLFVDTSQSPPGVRRDSNPIPNWRYFGPRRLGR